MREGIGQSRYTSVTVARDSHSGSNMQNHNCNHIKTHYALPAIENAARFVKPTQTHSSFELQADLNNKVTLSLRVCSSTQSDVKHLPRIPVWSVAMLWVWVCFGWVFTAELK